MPDSTLLITAVSAIQLQVMLYGAGGGPGTHGKQPCTDAYSLR